MKLNIIHKYYIIYIYIHLTIIHNTLAQTNKNMLQIYSQNQLIDILNNTITFNDQVRLTYKNINIQADTILIKYKKNTHNLSTITAHGNPVVVHQNQKNSHTLIAQAKIIFYNAHENIITLLNNACIKQSENFIQSDNITYSIKNKQIKATSTKNNQVTIMFAIKPT